MSGSASMPTGQTSWSSRPRSPLGSRGGSRAAAGTLTRGRPRPRDSPPSPPSRSQRRCRRSRRRRGGVRVDVVRHQFDQEARLGNGRVHPARRARPRPRPQEAGEGRDDPVDDVWLRRGAHHFGAGMDVRPPFRQLWVTGAGNLIEFPAVVEDDRVYVAQIEGRIFSINAETGKIVWSRDYPECAASSPTIAEGVVYQTLIPAPCNGPRDVLGARRPRRKTGKGSGARPGRAVVILYVMGLLISAPGIEGLCARSSARKCGSRSDDDQQLGYWKGGSSIRTQERLRLHKVPVRFSGAAARSSAPSGGSTLRHCPRWPRPCLRAQHRRDAALFGADGDALGPAGGTGPCTAPAISGTAVYVILYGELLRSTRRPGVCAGSGGQLDHGAPDHLDGLAYLGVRNLRAEGGA
jgi:hypothetical protein